MGVYAMRGELVLLVCGYRGCCGRVHETGRVGVVGVYTRQGEWVLWAYTRGWIVGVVGVYTKLESCVL